MKTERYQFPKSSFLSAEKDMGIIVDHICKNERLQKLLYYTTPDALERPRLTVQQQSELFQKNIKIVPKLYVDGSVLTYVIVNFDNFSQSSNPEFRDNVVEFDIICHFDQWQLQDFQLRPIRIAAELDTMFDKKHLTGIGVLEFMGANQMVLTDEFAGLCLMYKAYHGTDDKKFPLNPEDAKDQIDNFNKVFNER